MGGQEEAPRRVKAINPECEGRFINCTIGENNRMTK
jgi:hypothetical protein